MVGWVASRGGARGTGDTPSVTCACDIPECAPTSMFASDLGTKHPAMSAVVLSRFTMLGDASEKTTALSSGSP